MFITIAHLRNKQLCRASESFQSSVVNHAWATSAVRQRVQVSISHANRANMSVSCPNLSLLDWSSL